MQKAYFLVFCLWVLLEELPFRIIADGADEQAAVRQPCRIGTIRIYRIKTAKAPLTVLFNI